MAEPTGNVGSGGARGGDRGGEGPPPRMTEYPGAATDRPEDPAGYKPLSLFAILGLVISGAYGAFLLVSLLFAMISRSPMMVAGLSLLWPALGLLVSLIGWAQVQRSEGTRAGGRLATWGIGLSILFGLGYSAYLLGSNLALNQASEPYVVKWFDLIKEGKIEEAFIETLPPEQRPGTAGKSKQAIREELEARFGASPDPSRRTPGQFESFNSSELVRMLSQGGTDTKIVSRGVKERAYESNGHLVRNLFHVTTPYVECEVLVTVFGVEKKGSAGWSWQVRESNETGIVNDTQKPTPLGRRMQTLQMSVGLFVDQWNRALMEGRTADAFLMTRDPAERAQLSGSPKPLEDWPGFKEYREGGLIQVNPETLLAPAKVKAEVPALLRQAFANPASFRPGNDPAKEPVLVMFQPRIQNMRWSRDGDRLRVTIFTDVTYFGYSETKKSLAPRYLMDGSLVLETTAKALDDTEANPSWRLVSVEVKRALEAAATGAPGG